MTKLNAECINKIRTANRLQNIAERQHKNDEKLISKAKSDIAKYNKLKSKEKYIMFENFQWINEGEIKIEENKVVMKAPALTDFFCGGSTTSEEGILPESLCNAPYFYTEVKGDFVLNVKVSHDFKETYDSASVMIMQDMENWAKCCFELTDI